MTEATQFAQLSAPRQALLRLIQTLGFGYIEGLEVRSGEPVFNPSPIVMAERKLDAENAAHQEADLAGLMLRGEVVRLMEELDRLGNGTIDRIDVRYGVPRRVLIEWPLREVRR
ncbi:MAG: hypothetical protein HY820_04535 [Acidobacteria bacterium]|nr:hypothetical protein [Acidobacteriota bacterium]